MNYKQITIISIKILSLYILIKALTHLAIIANYYIIPIFTKTIKPQEEIFINLILTFAPFIVLVTVGLILWFYPERLANLIVTENQQDSIEKSSINYQELQSIAFSVVGIVLIAITIPEIFTTVGSLINFIEIGKDYATSQFRIEIIFLVIEKTIKLILGIGLFFGGKGLSRLLTRIREID